MAQEVKSANWLHWRERLERFALSGLTIAEFCRREGVSDASFYRWRQRIVDDSSKAVQSAQPTFVPVHVESSSLPARDVRVTLPNGATVAIPSHDRELVRTTIQAIANTALGKEDDDV